MIARHSRIAAAALTLAMLDASATPEPPAPIAIAPPPPLPARPAAPAIVAANFATPPRAADGSYITINRALTPEEIIWHMRAALNVAALGCRGTGEAAMIAGYNALLAGQKPALGRAYATVQAQHKARFGTRWQDAHDQRMTRVYNFFAQSTAHDAFCDAAAQVIARTPAIPPAALPAFAATSLPALEAPFTRFYAAWDDYRAQLAAWDARRDPNADPALRLATAAPSGPAPILAYAAIDQLLGWERPLRLADHAPPKRIASR